MATCTTEGGTFQLYCTVEDDTNSVWHKFASQPKVRTVRAVMSLTGDFVHDGMHLDKDASWTTAEHFSNAEIGDVNDSLWPSAIGTHGSMLLGWGVGGGVSI
jgi:hypothetical protein